jgi:hypothetical protein
MRADIRTWSPEEEKDLPEAMKAHPRALEACSGAMLLEIFGAYV